MHHNAPDSGEGSQNIPTAASIHVHFDVYGTDALRQLASIAPELGRIALPNHRGESDFHATVLPGIDATRAAGFDQLTDRTAAMHRLRRTVAASLTNRAAMIVPVHPRQPLAWFGDGSKLALRLDEVQLRQERDRLHGIIEQAIGRIAVDHGRYRPHVTLFRVNRSELTPQQIRNPAALLPQGLELPKSVMLLTPRVHLVKVPYPEDRT